MLFKSLNLTHLKLSLAVILTKNLMAIMTVKGLLCDAIDF